jgi:hypothetical protein
LSLIDGFWLPTEIRSGLLAAQTEYQTLSLASGRECAPGASGGTTAPEAPGAVTARWPRLQPEHWERLLEALHSNRARVPRGEEFWDRFQKALRPVGRRFADPSDALHRQAMAALPGYTGYSEPMIGFVLGSMGLWAPDELPAAFHNGPTWQAARRWQSMDRALPGRLRFYPESRWQQLLHRLPALAGRALFSPPRAPDLVVGYGAGNVPGTALLIAFLAQAVALTGHQPPAVVVKNSRREPIFTSLVLQAIEEEDPDLFCNVAVLIWDYDETQVQHRLLSPADLVLAAASDATIGQIQGAMTRANPVGGARLQAHGHKVSFSAIGRELLQRDLAHPASGQPMIEIVALLAGLDSVFWDQHGCLSSRVHFVEAGQEEHFAAGEYAARLAEQLQMLAGLLPRGAWPRQQLHDRFDRYKLLETTGHVEVFSAYDDPFVVALDQRPLDGPLFPQAVNDCVGRVILVRPVANLMQVPEIYLRSIPAANLQSLSVGVGHAGEGLTEHFLQFAERCGARGVTAIRTVGRGAFPQLAYSWDGFIPQDLVRRRPAGRFATIEFERPYDQIVETYGLMLRQGAALGVWQGSQQGGKHEQAQAE